MARQRTTSVVKLTYNLLRASIEFAIRAFAPPRGHLIRTVVTKNVADDH